MRRSIPRTLIALASLVALSVGSARAEVSYAKDVWPILKESCVKCHRAPYINKDKLVKPKGSLRLDTPSWIKQGSENGPVLIPGDPVKSSLYTLTILDPDDDDIMPAKGDPLTSAQQKILHDWIMQGASFGDWSESLVVMDINLPDAAVALMNQLNADGAVALPLAQGSDDVGVDLARYESPVDDALVQRLVLLSEHLVALDLSGSVVTASGIKTLSSFAKLRDVTMRGVRVDSAALVPLTTLPEIKRLNLFGTKADDGLLDHLVKSTSLETVVLSETAVTEAGVAALHKARPELRIRSALNLDDTMVIVYEAYTNSAAFQGRPENLVHPYKSKTVEVPEAEATP
ncbi:MAG: hypothetical protein ACI9OU_000539 [Candidatus Promineifilaceae bacterium]